MAEAGRVYALIGARAGSKGVPGKNIKPLGGHPLIAYSITAAAESGSVDRIVVSTDSEEIAEIARAYGAETPFLRPAELARDDSPDMGFFLHALDHFKGEEGGEPELLVQLRPTTPLRDPAAIALAVTELKNCPEATSLRSAHRSHQPVQKMFGLEGEFWKGLSPEDPRPEYFNLPRQAFPPAFNPNGYVDVLRPEVIRQGKGLTGGRIRAFITDPPGEIDGPEDFEFVEFLLSRRGYPLQSMLERRRPVGGR